MAFLFSFRSQWLRRCRDGFLLGEIEKSNIISVIGQLILDGRILDRVVFRDRPRVFYTRIAALGLPCASC